LDKEELTEIIEAECSILHRMFGEHNIRSYTPMLMGIHEDNSRDVILTPFKSDQEKYFMMEVIGMKLREISKSPLAAIVYIAEAWMKKFPKDMDISKVRKPSTYADREEGIVITAKNILENPGEEILLVKVLKIERDKNNYIILGEETGIETGDDSYLMDLVMRGYKSVKGVLT